jgi:hypothetical protein
MSSLQEKASFDGSETLSDQTTATSTPIQGRHSSRCTASLYAGTPYPPSTRARRAFVAARALTIVCCLVLFPLSFVAAQRLDRPGWQTPMLTPSIWVACRSAFDLYFVVRCGRRSHALVRLGYDGVLAVGLAVAAGFLVQFTMGDLTGTAAGADAATAGVAGATLALMFGDL